MVVVFGAEVGMSDKMATSVALPKCEISTRSSQYASFAASSLPPLYVPLLGCIGLTLFEVSPFILWQFLKIY